MVPCKSAAKEVLFKGPGNTIAAAAATTTT